MKNQKISSFIITFNEESLIERNINQLRKVSDEIIIVDSFSTDKTLNIIKKLQKNNENIKLYTKKFEGYGEQKSFAESLCANDFILNLDADEILSDEIIEEIIKLKSSGELSKYDYYNLKIYLTLNHQKSANSFLKPDIVARIYNKNICKYSAHPTFDRLLLTEKMKHKTLKNMVYHYSIKDVYQNLIKQIKYQEMLIENDKKRRNRIVLFIRLFFELKLVFLKFFLLRRMFVLGSFGFFFSIQAGFLSTYKIFGLIKKK